MFSIAVNHISKHTRGREDQTQVCEAKAKNWASPMGLEVDRGTEPEESDGPKDHCDENKRQPKLGFIYSLVFLCQIYANPVIQWTRNHLSDDSEDERGETDEAGLANGEIIGWSHEDYPIHDRKDNDPGDGCAWIPKFFIRIWEHHSERWVGKVKIILP